MKIEDARKLEIGTVVYFSDANYGYVNFGVVDSVLLEGTFYINLLSLAEHRYVVSDYVPPTPIDEFKTEETWHDLPKGWTYNTELFRIEERVPSEEREYVEKLRVDDPRSVQSALNKGFVVPARQIYHGDVNTEIRHGKWRIVKAYPAWTMHYGDPNPNYRVENYQDVFVSYDECRAHNDEINARREEIANMSDRDWSIYEIEQILKRLTPAAAERCRKYLMALPDLENVEVRKHGDSVEWRYWKKTKWQLADVENVPRETMVST